jgi:hypothetical protein
VEDSGESLPCARLENECRNKGHHHNGDESEPPLQNLFARASVDAHHRRGRWWRLLLRWSIWMLRSTVVPEQFFNVGVLGRFAIAHGFMIAHIEHSCVGRGDGYGVNVNSANTKPIITATAHAPSRTSSTFTPPLHLRHHPTDPKDGHLVRHHRLFFFEKVGE